MKEDQTQLITARLEHLQFMMDSGKMPIFRHRSDMFLFALEAHNIARGLSSRYYRLQEDLDIRFFVRFQFDYWLREVESWIKQLSGAEYRVEDSNFFAEGRAKRLTIVVDRLFHYHEDRLPADSAEGSKALPDDEILPPFRNIMQMRSTDLVASFSDALREVHAYLQKLAMLPVEWPAEIRSKALQQYLDDSLQDPQVQAELSDYRYFCCLPEGHSVKSQFCYLRQRIAALTSNGELASLKVSKNDCDQLLRQLAILFAREETSPAEDEIPANDHPMADDAHFAKLLYFVCLDGNGGFPDLDVNKAVFYLTRKDVFLTVEQERNLQALFALIGAMHTFFDPILARRNSGAQHTPQRQERINNILTKVKHYNSLLAPMLASNRQSAELDAFFDRLFSPLWLDVYPKAQDQLLKNFEADIENIKLKTYTQVIRYAIDTLHILAHTTAPGKQIHACLKAEDIVKGVSESSVQDYYSKTDYKSEDNWKYAIRLVEAVADEYKNK